MMQSAEELSHVTGVKMCRSSCCCLILHNGSDRQRAFQSLEFFFTTELQPLPVCYTNQQVKRDQGCLFKELRAMIMDQ